MTAIRYETGAVVRNFRITAAEIRGDASIEEIRRLTCRIAKLEAERQWRPIETAPRDGTPILALTRSDLCSRLGRGDLGVWECIRVVVHYQGVTSSGFDPGWSVSAPVGYGIGRDNWFAGWLPLPATPVKDNVDAQD